MSRTPNSGSFIKVNNLIKVGKTMSQCYKEKYEHDGSGDSSKVQAIGSKKVEYVGLDKIRNRTIRSLVLDDMDVSTVESNNFFITFTLLCEIHLVNTLVNNWNDVFKLCDQIENLSLLNLSKNIFDWSCIEDNVYTKIKTLMLNEADLKNENLKSIVVWFPNLSRFDVNRNFLDSINGLRSLEDLNSLDISFNSFTDWRNVEDLGSLKRLEELNLSNNLIVNISIDRKSFDSLKIFNLANNAINEWNSVDELEKLAALENVNLLANPVCDLDFSRSAIISRVRKLKVLNKCEISITERTNAVETYFRMCGRALEQLHANESEMKAFFHSHPKFAKHYESTAEKNLDFDAQKNRCNFIDLVFKCEGKNSVHRKLSDETTIRKLRFMVSRLFNEPPLKIKLDYENLNRPGIVLPLDNDARTLGFYSLQDGDSIFVSK